MTLSPLTPKQRKMLDFLSEAIAQQGYAPSFEEIAEKFNYQSLATVHEHLSYHQQVFEILTKTYIKITRALNIL